MFKKILLFLVVLITPAYSAQIVNVEYVHKLIKQVHNVDVSYNPELRTEKQAANMKYLLTAIDVANEKLNGWRSSDYGNGEFATTSAADTVATIQAVNTLIKKSIEYPFSVVPDVAVGNTFSFSISAAGTFYVDWGDGAIQVINKPDTVNSTYSHTYSNSASNYTVRLGGQATGYNTDIETAAVSFAGAAGAPKISALNGCLGCVFSTLADGTNPRFYQVFYHNKNIQGSPPENLFTELDENGQFVRGVWGSAVYNMFAWGFEGCVGLTDIPSNLFIGIRGTPAPYMFAGAFYNCSGLGGKIPSELFIGIDGTPAPSMFAWTFFGCTGLTGEIPNGLFAGVTGAPADSMFSGTFAGCSGLTKIPDNLFAGVYGVPVNGMFYRTFYNCNKITSIPDNLFAGVYGAPATAMFSGTFGDCWSLTSIPANLFGNISGSAQNNMFEQMFYNCSSLTGPSARINGQYLYNIWPGLTTNEVYAAYTGATGLTDYANIPSAWK